MQVSLQKAAVVLYGSLVRDQPKRVWVLLGVMKGWTLSGMSPYSSKDGWKVVVIFTEEEHVRV